MRKCFLWLFAACVAVSVSAALFLSLAHGKKPAYDEAKRRAICTANGGQWEFEETPLRGACVDNSEGSQ